MVVGKSPSFRTCRGERTSRDVKDSPSPSFFLSFSSFLSLSLPFSLWHAHTHTHSLSLTHQHAQIHTQSDLSHTRKYTLHLSLTQIHTRRTCHRKCPDDAPNLLG